MTLEQAAEDADVSIYKAIDLTRRMELILRARWKSNWNGLEFLVKKIKSSNF